VKESGPISEPAQKGGLPTGSSVAVTAVQEGPALQLERKRFLRDKRLARTRYRGRDVVIAGRPIKMQLHRIVLTLSWSILT
jgi:hypothetical protein